MADKTNQSDRRAIETAYIAGIIDGEGYIGFRLCNDKDLYVSIVVQMTNFAVPKLLYDRYGGSLLDRKQVGNRKLQFCWKAYAENSGKVLNEIFPHLIVKKKQAVLALVYLDLDKQQKLELTECFKENMHILNKRGL